MKLNYKQIFTIIGIVFLTIISVLMAFFPLSQSFYVSNGDVIHAWIFECIAQCYPLFLILSILGALGITYASKKLFVIEDGCVSKIVLGITPLVWLFPITWAAYLSPWIGAIAAALFIPLGYSIVLSIVLDNLFFKYFNDDPSPKITKRLVLISTIIYTFFFGIYYQTDVENPYSSAAGGDVKHYLTMHKSLMNDGNLELTNELKSIQEELGYPDSQIADLARRSHMKKNKEGKYYSYHSFGLPLLSYLSASWLGEFGVFLLITLIAMLAMLGCFKVSLLSGGSKRAAFIISWLLVMSCGWIFIGVAFLPEMLGMALTAWGIWGILALENKSLRYRAMYVTAICAGYLPYAHIRFVPISLLIVFFFGIEYLFFSNGEKFWFKIKKLILPIVIYGVFCVCLLYFHTTMYSGNQSYNYNKILFGYPVAMWLVLCAQRSLGSVMPCVFGMLASVPFVLAQKGRNSRIALYSLGIFVGILVSCCTNRASLGGACVPGRYLVHCIPALLPVVVIAFSKGGCIVRRLYLSLAWISVLAFFVMGHGAKTSRGAFIRLPEKIRNYAGFENLLDPFASVEVSSPEFIWGSIFVGGIILGMALLFFASSPKLKKPLTVIGCIILCVAFYSGLVARDNTEDKRISNHTFLILDKYKYFTFDLGNFVDVFDLFCHENEKSIFQFGEGFEEKTNRTYGFNSIPVNDWAGRNRRWFDLFLNQIRYNECGGIAIYLKGRVEGGNAYCQIRQGSENITDEIVFSDGNIEGVWIVPIKRGKGFLYCFVSIENEDVKLTLDKTLFVPYSKYFTSDIFKMPENVRVYDLRDVSNN